MEKTKAEGLQTPASDDEKREEEHRVLQDSWD
jgi:hypothetical protein